MTSKLASVYASRLFGALGFQIFSIFAALRAFEISPKLSTMGWLGFATFLSVALFSFLSGSWIDRVANKGLYALLLHAAIAAISIMSVFLPANSLLPLYGLAFAIGSFRVMRSPVYFVLAKELMTDDSHDLGPARLFVASWQLAGVLGPLLSGIVALNFGLQALQLLYCLFFAAAFACLIPVAALRAVNTSPFKTDQPNSNGLVDSVRFFIKTRVVRETFVIDTIGILFAGASAFLPFLLTSSHLSPSYLGVIRAAQNAGALLVTLSLSRQWLNNQTGKLFLVSVLAFSALTITVPFATTLSALLIVFSAMGLTDGVSILIRDLILFQTATPQLRGRIYALNSIFISSSDDLGELESGLAGHVFGIPAAAIGGGLICGAIALYFTTQSKDLWSYQLQAERKSGPQESAA